MTSAFDLFERGLLPAFLMKAFIRRVTAASLRKFRAAPVEKRAAYHAALVRKLKRSPVAVHVDTANVQHYELPPEFFQTVLGKRMKYSCCYWPSGVRALDESEERMLDLTCRRAQVEDGQTILDLGCGWGSLALWIAQRYPKCDVTAVSNSRLQRDYIRKECGRLGISNVEAITADAAEFTTKRRFDRVISIEMFEHIKNYDRLMEKIAGFLVPDGMLFVHIFCHREVAFEYLKQGPNRWMAEHFFTGGNMPSFDLILHFQRDLHLVRSWAVSGTHYRRTLKAWRKKLEANKPALRALFGRIYGLENGRLWYNRWRLFFLVCEVNFGFRGGDEYFVAHYLFHKPPAQDRHG